MTEADLEKARILAGHLSTLPQLASQSTPCWGRDAAPILAQALAEARHAEELISVHWQRRAEAAEARVKDLVASMVGHFQRDHLEGDGPEIDRWRRRIKALEDALSDVLGPHMDGSDTISDQVFVHARTTLEGSATGQMIREELNRG